MHVLSVCFLEYSGGIVTLPSPSHALQSKEVPEKERETEGGIVSLNFTVLPIEEWE